MKRAFLLTLAMTAFSFNTFAADKATAPAAAEHKKHDGHDHKHGDKCGHKAAKHGDHTDFDHDGHKHKNDKDHVDECEGDKKS